MLRTSDTLLALVTLDLYPEVGQSKTRHLLQTMAATLSNTTVWHKSLRNITVISGENLDKFVNKQGVGKQTTATVIVTLQPRAVQSFALSPPV